MKKITTFALFSLLVSSCNKSETKQTPDKSNTSNSITRETREANTKYKPAFVGQTRANFIKTKADIEVTTVAENLGAMWGIVTLPNGNFLATVKSGHMVVINPIDGTFKEIKNLPKVNHIDQGGLLDVILDPDFKTNNTIYFTFSEPVNDGEKNDHTSLAKATLSKDETKLENIKIIYKTFPSINSEKHYGSRLAFDKDGLLYMTVGERSVIDTRPLAQDLTTPLGKILRLTKDGKPAPGNPFINTPNALPEIYSLGHRSPQGLVFNNEGQLWETEHGPRGGDELNLIESGKNYGWPVITYGIEYTGEKIGDGVTQKEGLEQPNYYWDPVVAPSGAEFYYGNIAEWKGNLFIGGMKDMTLVRLQLKDNRVVGEEHLLLDKKDRIRDVVTGKDGNLYAIGDNGKLYKIAKK